MDESTDEFHLFIKAVKDSCITLEVEAKRRHPLAHTLRQWGDTHGFVSAASWTKKILVGILARPSVGGFWTSLRWGYPEGATLLGCFGRAFSGDKVGHVGRDVLEPCLHHPDPGVAAAALEVLKSWERDDGTWWPQMLEQSSSRKVQQLEFRGVGFERGAPMIMGYQEPMSDSCLESSATRHASGTFELDLKDLKALDQYFEMARELPNSCRATVQHPELPGFLTRVLELDPVVTLGLLESRKVGSPCVRQSTLEVHVDGDVVRAWNAEMAVSIEPTTTSGTWSVVTHWT